MYISTSAAARERNAVARKKVKDFMVLYDASVSTKIRDWTVCENDTFSCTILLREFDAWRWETGIGLFIFVGRLS